MNCSLVPLRTKHGTFVGWIDVRQCTFVADRADWDLDDAWVWESLIRTPAGRFLVYNHVLKTEPPSETVDKYAVFIKELEAVSWFADDPGSAPECMRPLVEKFLTLPDCRY